MPAQTPTVTAMMTPPKLATAPGRTWTSWRVRARVVALVGKAAPAALLCDPWSRRHCRRPQKRRRRPPRRSCGGKRRARPPRGCWLNGRCCWAQGPLRPLRAPTLAPLGRRRWTPMPRSSATPLPRCCGATCWRRPLPLWPRRRLLPLWSRRCLLPPRPRRRVEPQQALGGTVLGPP
jgi:hypothetical protein